MRIENDHVTGDVVISQNTQYNHIDARNVVVEENVVARLYGLIQENITVKKMATVYLHGKCSGKIINEGGVLYLFDPSGQVLTY